MPSCSFDSYLRTHHSRSLQPSLTKQPGAADTLTHSLSGRSYDILEKGGRLFHREWQHFPQQPHPPGDPVALADSDPRMFIAELPVSYVIGSGSFAKGYLLSDGPYLLQSPVTWYKKPNALEMAPGYDFPTHAGMSRVLTDQCLFCHAGIVSRQAGNDEQVNILEGAIGCERCHGPGQDHSNKFKKLIGNSVLAGEAHQDPMIVHPGKLSRALAEAICAQCHLQGDVVVDATNKSIWDFMPGRRLDETRVIFKIDSPKGEQKTFVDHFDQMWQSKCYQRSDSLTCITCHDPHHTQSSQTTESYHQANCLKCHDNESACGISLPERHRQNENQCVRCHMPTSASEVPHSAITSHQIGIHDSEVIDTEKTTEAQLRRLHSPLDPPPSSGDKRTQALATAFWALGAIKPKEVSGTVTDRTLNDLLDLSLGRQDDAKILSTIAQLARKKAERLPPEMNNPQILEQYWETAGRYAAMTLALTSEPTEDRKHALEIMGAKQFEVGNFASAAQSYQELVTIRRSAIDWYNLGLCFGRLKQFTDAQRAFAEAIRIDGTYAPPYLSLSILYASINPQVTQQMRQTYDLLISQQQSLKGQ